MRIRSIFLLIILFSAQALAQEPMPCDSCTSYPQGAYMRSSGDGSSGGTYKLSCQSGTWENVNADPADPCSSCTPPAVGTTCDNGSIYAGLSPDGNVAMYTTPADAGGAYTWNEGSSNWVDTAMANCTDTSPGMAATCQTGEANTAFLVALNGSGSPAPYYAAEYCDGLSAHGYNDWYLPAQDELNVLYINKNTGDLNGTFNETGFFPAGYYWSSSERNSISGQSQRFSVGSQNGLGKDDTFTVRCVRK